MAKAAAILFLEQADRIRTLERILREVGDTLAAQQEAGECITNEVDAILLKIPEVLGEAPRISATEVDRLSRRIDNHEHAMREAVRLMSAAPVTDVSLPALRDLKSIVSTVKVGLEEALK